MALPAYDGIHPVEWAQQHRVEYPGPRTIAAEWEALRGNDKSGRKSLARMGRTFAPREASTSIGIKRKTSSLFPTRIRHVFEVAFVWKKLDSRREWVAGSSEGLQGWEAGMSRVRACFGWKYVI